MLAASSIEQQYCRANGAPSADNANKTAASPERSGEAAVFHNGIWR